MIVPDWQSVAEFESWWRINGRELRRMTVATPPLNFEIITNPEWHAIAEKIEAFQERRNRGEVT